LIKTTLTLLVRNACKQTQHTLRISVSIRTDISFNEWHTQSCVNNHALQGTAQKVEKQRKQMSWQLSPSRFNSLAVYTNWKTNGQTEGNCVHGISDGKKAQKAADEAAQALHSGQLEVKGQAKGH